MITRIRTARLAAGLVLAMGLISAMIAFGANPALADTAGPPSGDGVQPILIDGNVDCAALNANNAGFPSITGNFGFKLDSVPPNGTHTFTNADGVLTGGAPSDPGNSVTISGSDGEFFDWIATLDIDAVIVKAGSNADVFVYIPEDDADTNLHAPLDKNGDPRTISHVEFCYDYPPVVEGAALGVSKDADGSYDNTYTWDIDKSVSDDEVFTAGGEPATVDYTVSVSHNAGAVSNVQVSGTITVTNPNDADLTIDTIVDTLDGTACDVDGTSDLTIPANGDQDYSYTCDLGDSLPAGDVVNHVEITWSDQTIDGVHLPAGENAFTTGAVDFSENTIDECVDVTDTLHGDLGQVCVGGDNPTVFEYEESLDGPAGTCTEFDNTASFETTDSGTTGDSNTVTVTDCQGANLQVSKTANPAFTRTFTWDIDKSVDDAEVFTVGGAPHTFNYTVEVSHDDGTDSAWTVTGVITVTNPNDWQSITLTELVDEVDNGGTCTVDTSAGLTIPASGSQDFPYECTYASEPTAVNGTNKAIAKWNADAAHTTHGTKTGTADFDFDTPTSVTDDCTMVDDTNANGPQDTLVCVGDDNPTTFDYSATFTDPAGTCTSHDNTASITNNDTEATDSETVTVTDCQGADLTVSKTANPAFDRTFTWDIDKSVNKTYVEQTSGTVTFNYTIDVTHDAGTDSGWTVTGKITVTNPNDWQDITVDVTDAVDNGGVCTVVGGDDVVVLRSDSVTLDYSCTYAAAPNPTDGTNTATATWNAAAAYTPNGSASGTAAVNFSTATPTLIDECVTVVDDNATPANTADDVTLGTVCNTDPSPKTFTFSKTVPVPAPLTCVEYVNTATFTTNDTNTTDDDSQTVKVCSFQQPLTPGYWKNHLGPTAACKSLKLPSGTGCSNNGPFANSYFTQTLGTFPVSSIDTAAKVFSGMNCGSSKDQDAIGCLAGHLLAAKLNVANGANPCIAATIAAADAFLTSINYTGPSGKYVLNATQRATAIALKSALDTYNNGGGC